MSRKWRPSLWFVLGGALAGTLALSVIGLIVFRYLGPEIGFRNAAKLLAAVIGALTVVLWLLLLRLLLRPVGALSAYAAAMREPRSPVLDPPGRFGTRELYEMGQSVIDMAETLHRREGTVRSFTQHATHELKTPVSSITAAAELLEDSPDLSDADRRLVAQIRGAVAQMQDQLAALRAVVEAREAGHSGQVRLDALLPDLRSAHPALELSVTGGGLALPISGAGLRVVLDHLLGNAAAHGASRVALRGAQVGDAISLVVTDDGPGISQGNRGRIFDPFFTTRRNEGGTGMGLFITRNLLDTLGAAIALDEGTEGTAFRITFGRG